MNNSTSLQHHQTKSLNKQQDNEDQQEEEEEEEEEDALSLCDLALNSGEPERNSDDGSSIQTHRHQRSSSQPPDLFEFCNDLKSDYLSHAEDIIHGGKLIPFKQQSVFDDQILILSRDYDSTNFTRRFCESLPAARSNGYADTDTRLKRSSRSLDREKLRRNSSLVMKSEAHRSSSKGVAKSEASKAGSNKPKWYDLIFGSVKFPPEMDLRDMKNRQVHRNPGTMFPAGDGGMSSWGQDLLRVLSCKNHPSSVEVTASIGLVPQL